LQPRYSPGSASNRNGYQESSWGKRQLGIRLTTTICEPPIKCGSLDVSVYIYTSMKPYLQAQPVANGQQDAELIASPSQNNKLHMIRFNKMGAQMSLHLNSHATLYRSLVTVEDAALIMSIYT
jgi:hypothetical protein